MDILKAYSLKSFPVALQQPKKKQKNQSSEAFESGSSNYLCYNCNRAVVVTTNSRIICSNCNCRILVKKTEKKSINYSCV